MKISVLSLLFLLIVSGCTTPSHLKNPYEALGSDDNALRQRARTELRESFAQATAPEADPEIARALEARIIAELNTPLPLSERLFLIRLLEWFGGEASVAPLVGLAESANPHLRDSALRALSSVPQPAAGAALRAFLREGTPAMRQQILDTLVYREDSAGIETMIQLLEAEDPALVEASALALGKLGAGESVAALQTARNDASGNLRTVIEGALLNIGVGVDLAADLAESGSNAAIRAAAYEALLAQDTRRADRVLLVALRDPDALGRERMLRESILEGPDTLRRELVRALPSMAEDDQIVLVEAVGAAQLSEYESNLLAIVPRAGETLKSSLVTVLSEIGGDESYEALYAAFVDSPRDQIVAEAVARLRAPSADRSALAAAQTEGDPGDRVAAIQVLALRNSPGATALLNDIVSTPGEGDVREEAIKALETVGNLESVRQLAKLITDQDPLKRRAQLSLKRLSIHFDAPNTLWEEAFGPELDRALNAAVRADLIAILDGVACDSSLAYIAPFIADPTSNLHASAVKVLERWPMAHAGDLWIDHLLGGDPSGREVARAQRALVRLLRSENVGGSAEDKLALAVRAVQNAPSIEFKEAIVQSYDRTLEWQERRHIEEIFAPILDDPDVGDLVRSVLPN